MKKATVVLLSLAIVCILILADCNDNSTNTSDVTASAKATEKIENTHKPLSTAYSTGTAQTAEPTNSTVEPTKVPTPTPTAIAQPTADPAIYNDDWGYSMDNSNTLRSNFQELFWTKTRNLVKIPKELQNLGFDMIDPENEQIFIATGFIDEGTLTYYALRDGVFYKLNQGKIIDKCFNGFDAFGWVEEDGTACTIGERSKYWNEVYIEGTNCKGIAYRIGGKLVVISQSGEVMDVNKEDILRETTIIK